MRPFVISIMLIFLFLVTLDYGYSEELDTTEHVFAIQEKIFHKYHELTFATGYIPSDDFYHVYPVGLSYTFHFDEHISWEVGRLYANFNMEKDLLDDLLTGFGAAPVAYYEPGYQLLTHFVYRPFYGKDSIMNKWVVNNETYFFVGGGIDLYTKKYPHGYTSDSDEAGPVFSFGAGIKYFVNDNFNISFELRDFVTYRDDEADNNVWFGVNMGFRFNLGARQSYSDDTLEILDGYLKDKKE